MPQVASPYLTPSAVAERFGVDVHKVIVWIRRGELRAIDVATTTGGRPRYRISPADLAVFEVGRSATPQPKITRGRRKNPLVTEFF